ncbi:MAG TPA: c-type cytochrome domain-containing protein, partial [Chitinophagaceae bacterium]
MHLLNKNTRVLLLLTSSIIFITCKHEPLFEKWEEPPTESTNCSADSVYFQQQVLPIFISNCTESGCHDATSHEEGIVLTTYNGIMATGKVKAYQPNNSELYKVMVATNPDERMPPPPKNAISPEQLNIVYKWIAQGAKNNSCSNSCDSNVFGFNGAIKPIITSKCQGCHSGSNPQGSIDLATYITIKAAVDNGKLWGSINHLAGYSPMPKNGTKLSPCEL